MYVKPAVNAARFRENLAAAMVARGHDAAQLSKRAGLDPGAVNDLLVTGRASDAQVASLADYLDCDPAELAPLIDLRDPDRRDRLPPEGRDVPETTFWLRRIADGDVVVAPPPSATPQTTAGPVVAGTTQRAAAAAAGERKPAAASTGAQTDESAPSAAAAARKPE